MPRGERRVDGEIHQIPRRVVGGMRSEFYARNIGAGTGRATEKSTGTAERPAARRPITAARRTRAGSWRRAHSAARAASDEDSARETTATRSRARSEELIRISKVIRKRRTFTRRTIAGSDTTQGGTILTTIWIIPGSMDVSPERLGHSTFGGCTEAIASASTWADSFFRRRHTTTTPAATGCGIAMTS